MSRRRQREEEARIAADIESRLRSQETRKSPSKVDNVPRQVKVPLSVPTGCFGGRTPSSNARRARIARGGFLGEALAALQELRERQAEKDGSRIAV